MEHRVDEVSAEVKEAADRASDAAGGDTFLEWWRALVRAGDHMRLLQRMPRMIRKLPRRFSVADTTVFNEVLGAMRKEPDECA